MFQNPGLARSLRIVAEGGRDAYYRGPLAEAIVAYSQAVGGLFKQPVHQLLRHASLAVRLAHEHALERQTDVGG